MTLQQLNYIITISETGSINKAAERLYLSQPTLTSAIKTLEQELDIVIFNRTGKGVTLTADGAEFLPYARQVYGQYQVILDRYGKNGERRQKFAVSCQHYSFAVKAFVEMARSYDMAKYEFAIRETRTLDVIHDVAQLRSEIGILYLSDFNRKALLKLLSADGISFYHLIHCKPHVYLSKNHPLAGRPFVRLSDLEPYPCLAFEQGDASSFYFAEEILATHEFPRLIKTTDRATSLSLMTGLNAYALCASTMGVELNGSNFIAIPYQSDEEDATNLIDVGYILKNNAILSSVGQCYLDKLKHQLNVGV